jgi:hypothetical protein
MWIVIRCLGVTGGTFSERLRINHPGCGKKFAGRDRTNVMFKGKKKPKITSVQFEQEVKKYLASTFGQFAGVTEIW